MKHCTMARIPWATNEKGTVHYEFRVGRFYEDLGVCKAIVKHEEDHVEVLFENRAITYYKSVITEHEID